MSETTSTTDAGTDTSAADTTTTDTTTDTTDTSVDTGQAAADATADDGKDPRVTRANQEAARYRTQLREAQTELSGVKDTLAKLAAVFNPDATSADPAEQLATITGEAESLRTENAGLRAELLVHDLASDHNANPKALLDSRTFTDSLKGLDPSSEDYRDKVAEAIKTAVEKHDTFRVGQVPSAGGAPNAGQGAGGSDAVTQEQFNAMSMAERTALANRDIALYRRLAGTA